MTAKCFHWATSRYAALVFSVSFLFQPIRVAAQTSPATLPDLKLSTAGSVSAVAVQADGKIVIGGYFTTVNGFARNGLARLNVDGTVDVDWNPNVNGAGIYSIAISGTNIYVGGQFIAVGGQTLDNLAKLDMISGAADPAWKPNPRTDGFFDGNGRVVSVIVVGNNVYASGYFYNASGDFSHPYLARFNANGAGSIDSSWNPSPSFYVTRIVSDGTNVFAAGNFTSIGGQSRNYLAKLNTVSGAADASWNPSPNATLSSMVLDGTNLYVSGSFTSIGGQGRNYVAKLSTVSGVVNPNWNANVSSLLNGNVQALTVIGTNLFMGGNSTNVGGLNRNTLAKVNTTTGAIDPNWSANPNRLNSIAALIAAQTGGLLVAGNFQNFSGTRSLGFARLDLVTGARDDFFPVQVEQPGVVSALAQQPDGKIIVGGDFYLAGGLERPNLARINPDASLDLAWSPKADGTVNAIAVSGTNVFVGGNFTAMNGLRRNRVAKLNTGSPDAVDTNWNPNADNSVSCLVATNNDVFIGGSFASVGGLGRNVLAKLSATGTGAADTNWNPNPTGGTYDPASYVAGMSLNGTSIFVGGNFTSIGGLNRTCLAKLSTSGTGAADNNFTGQINRLVIAVVANDSNVYAGGQFFGPIGNHVAKFSAASGAQDSSWNPGVSDPSGRFAVSALALGGTNLYVGGNFGNVGGQTRSGIVKLDALNAGVVDPTWHHDAANTSVEGSASVNALLVNNSDVYAGGTYVTIEGAQRGGFALLSVPHAPQLIQDTATDLFIFPNAADKTTTHFQITAITGCSLFKSDGVTPVKAGDFITGTDGAAGLKIVSSTGSTGSVTAVSSLNDTFSGAGTAAMTLTLSLTPPAAFMLGAATYSTKEGGVLTIPVKKIGNGSGSVSYTTSSGTAQSGTDFQPRSGTLSFTAGESQKNLPLISIANDFAFTGDRVFNVSLTNSSSGTVIGSPAKATVTIIDDDGIAASDSFLANAPSAPLAPPVSSGVMKVSLQPTNTGGQWRLLGELSWHDSDATISGLVSGNYAVEFRLVNGYRQPETQTLPINAGQTNPFSFFYTAISATETGNLYVTIQPADVATNSNLALRGQWRRQGETSWHDSGEVLQNLNSGSYSVEYKPVTGRLAPTPQIIVVGGNADYGAVATYLVGSSSPGALTPAVVPFDTATTNSPYRYNGQIQTSIGFGSGAVVKQRVVLTVAHELFDDVLLSYTTVARWFFQRYRDQLEPVPLTPRGWYVFDGYSSQRKLDKSPGISTPESQSLDAAALYFLEDAGRGGYGGFLASDAVDNEFLLGGNNKFLAGYPLDGVVDVDKGKLFATSPTNIVFSKTHDQIYATTQIASYPGNSGGPLYVQNDDGVYYPAGIYLGGSGETLVRAISGEVVDLINRAEVSGNGGGNSTGGGVASLSPGVTAPAFGAGLITVNLSPSNATSARLGWRIAGFSDTNFITTPSATMSLIGGASYPVEFKFATGFLTPSNRTVMVAVGGLVTIQGNYISLQPAISFSRSNGLNFQGVVGSNYRVEFTTNFTAPTNIWTTLTNITLTNNSQIIGGTLPPKTGRRFFRAVLGP